MGSLTCSQENCLFVPDEFHTGKHACTNYCKTLNVGNGAASEFCAWVADNPVEWFLTLKAFIKGQLVFFLMVFNNFLTFQSSSQCVGCCRLLRGTETGVQVRVRKGKPYCDGCYFQLRCKYWCLQGSDPGWFLCTSPFLYHVPLLSPVAKRKVGIGNPVGPPWMLNVMPWKMSEIPTLI